MTVFIHCVEKYANSGRAGLLQLSWGLVGMLHIMTCLFSLVYNRGARLVDHGCECEYECENYSSITGKQFVCEMNEKINLELEEGKVRVVSHKPRCIHSL